LSRARGHATQLSGMNHSRRTFLKAVGAASTALVVPEDWAAEKAVASGKSHIVTLSFDDGFKQSFTRTAAIYEKHKLSACLNVVAAGLPEDAYIKSSPLGDFALWNELKRRGHEVMPHGYRHENLQKLPLEEGQELIRRCLGVFSEKLEGFDPKQTIFNFPYNASTPELERWLPTQVRAFRTGGSDQPAAAQGPGQADLHQLRPRRLRGSHRSGNRQPVGARVRLADLQYARPGRRRLGPHPRYVSGTPLGAASRRRNGRDLAGWRSLGEVRILRSARQAILI